RRGRQKSGRTKELRFHWVQRLFECFAYIAPTSRLSSLRETIIQALSHSGMDRNLLHCETGLRKSRMHTRACTRAPNAVSLFSKNADTAIAALRGAYSTRLQGHKCVVVAGVNRDAVRVRIGRDIFQPCVCLGIDDAHKL